MAKKRDRSKELFELLKKGDIETFNALTFREELSWLNDTGGKKYPPPLDLKGVDLSVCNLQTADLSRADLRQANLRGASLAKADLRKSDLRGANLAEVDFTDADLRGADLRGANFTNVRLLGANLWGTRLDPQERLLVMNQLTASWNEADQKVH